MSEMFLPVGKSRITRRSKNKLNQPFRKSNKGQYGLSYLRPKIWNNLHSDLKSSESINNFTHKIKANFFKELQSEKTSLMNITKFSKFENKTSFDHYSLHRYRIYILTLFFLLFKNIFLSITPLGGDHYGNKVTLTFNAIPAILNWGCFYGGFL